MANTTTEIMIETQPYKPSWIDRFNNWVEKLPVSVWIFYIIFGIVLILVQMLFLWLDGGLYAVELLPVIIFNSLATPFLLAVIHLLDNQAVTALRSMRPMLDTVEQEFAQYEYKLSNMPFLAPLIAGLIILVSTLLTPLVTIDPIRYAALDQLPVFAVVYHIIDKSSAFLFGVVIYHTIRQLRLIDSINSKHIRINLFYLQPLQGFSRLTASTASGLVVFVYAWMFINPELLTDPILLGYALLFTMLAVSIFVWPLWGVHRLIEMEKGNTLHEIDQRFEAVFSKFNQYIHDEDYTAAEMLKGTITSLDIQYNRINSIPTWPWRSETARLVLTAIALPLMLMIIQYFVVQALNQ
jgi:hypothetical protein